MALLFMDGFDHYSTTEFASGLKWDTNGGYHVEIVSNGRFGKCAGISRGDAYMFKDLAVGTTGIVGFAWRVDVTPWAGSYTEGPLVIMETSGTIHLTLMPTLTNPTYLKVYHGDGTLLATGTVPIQVGTWNYVEFKFTIGDTTTGSYELRVNEQTAASGSSIDTRNGGTGSISRIKFPGSYGSNWNPTTFALVDDVYIKSDTTFLGDCRVETLYPSGNGNSSSWIGSDGNSTDNYALVDETPPNGDTDYVKSTTLNAVDSYALADLATASGTVHGVQYLAYLRKDDAGSRSAAPLVRIGSTDYPGTAVALGNSYVYLREMKETSPATATAWTISEINGMEYGAKVTL